MWTQIRLTPKWKSFEKKKTRLYGKPIKRWSSSIGKKRSYSELLYPSFSTQGTCWKHSANVQEKLLATLQLGSPGPGMNGWSVNPPSSRVTSEIMRLRTYHRYIQVVLAVHHLFIDSKVQSSKASSSQHFPTKKKHVSSKWLFHLDPSHLPCIFHPFSPRLP